MLGTQDIKEMIRGLSASEANCILRPLRENGIITSSCYRQIYEELTKKEILAKHTAKISQHADGRWRTYVVTAEGKKRQLVRTVRSKLEDDIVQNYKEVHNIAGNGPSFKTCYFRWRELHDMKTSENTQSLCRGAAKSLLNYIKGTFRSAKNNRTIKEDVTKDIQRSEFFCKCVDVERKSDAVLVPDQDWKLLYERLQHDFQDTPAFMPPYAIMMAALIY